MNSYKYDGNGNLLHFINDELRATVPVESVAEYQESWPDAPSAPSAPFKYLLPIGLQRDEVQS